MGGSAMKVRKTCAAVSFGISMTLAMTASAAEFKTYTNTKYGFELKIPKQFELKNEDKTVDFVYQPGSAPAAAAAPTEKKPGGKLSVGGVLKGVGISVEKSVDTPATPSAGGGGGGELQSALSIYINWTWFPDVPSGSLYDGNKKGIQQDVSSPDPKYKEIIDFDTKKGYAYAGNTFWWKEIDKKGPDEIHRWHIYSAGNKSAYTIGLCGSYGQFKEWGPVYEEVVKSFKLIPMKDQK
jgi:hypothetical protein